jgi:flagellar biosynthesis protein FlhB
MNRLTQTSLASTATLASMILIANITGGQIVEGLTDYQKSVLRSKYVRWVAIYAILFAAFGNFLLTGVVTFFVVVILDYLLNENSRYYLFRRHEQGRIKTIGSDAARFMFN